MAKCRCSVSSWKPKPTADNYQVCPACRPPAGPSCATPGTSSRSWLTADQILLLVTRALTMGKQHRCALMLHEHQSVARLWTALHAGAHVPGGDASAGLRPPCRSPASSIDSTPKQDLAASAPNNNTKKDAKPAYVHWLYKVRGEGSCMHAYMHVAVHCCNTVLLGVAGHLTVACWRVLRSHGSKCSATCSGRWRNPVFDPAPRIFIRFCHMCGIASKHGFMESSFPA
jgi:hypothetical protein